MTDNITPLVSVVIPAYNHGRYLFRALQSVLNQTYINWEAIVIDNHSTDNTDEVLASFVDPRIKCLKICNHGVIAVSRNFGIREAKGKWIAFLDSDDCWEKDKLEKVFNFILVNRNIDLVYHDMEIISDRTKCLKKIHTKSRKLKSPVLIDLLVNGNPICMSSVVVRTRLLRQINGMNENIKIIGSEDYNTWLRLSELTNNFFLIPNTLGYYLDHPQGVSKKDMSENIFHAAEEFLKLLNPLQRNEFNIGLTYTSGRYKYLQKDFKQAKKLLLKTCKSGRVFIRIKSLIMLILMLFHINSKNFNS